LIRSSNRLSRAVEGRGVDLMAARERDVVRRNCLREIGVVDDRLPRGALAKWHQPDSGGSLVVRRSGNREEQRAVTRSKCWPAMADFAGIDGRQRQLFRPATALCDLHQPAVLRGGKHDVPVGEPHRPERLRRVGDDDRHPTGDGNLPQLSCGKETDPSAVRREEWRARIIGP